MSELPRSPEAMDDELDGDSYLASLSDLMVGMLFVFIIMLMAFALTYRKAEEASDLSNKVLQAKVHDYKQRNATLDAARSLLTENDLIRRSMLRRLQSDLAERGVQVIIDEQNGILRLGNDLLFDSGAAELRESGIEALKELAALMASLLPCYAHSDIPATQTCPPNARPILEGLYIEGHTDNRPIKGTFENNWALSAARAVKTYGMLTQSEPRLLELKNLDGRSLLGVSGYGEERPVASNDTAEGRAQNRRIDLRFLLAAPSQDDLKRLQEESRRRDAKAALP